ncbi:PD-(D/E)XK motif protein [Roseovarius pacificus]|uniref:PD-(D/E)XK motif protein n=1 Tax=Roseovarius pacificus TaxID=337701 RepID=UPI00403A69B2
MTGDEIEDIWKSVEAEGASRPGWHARKISRGSPHDLLAGRKMPSGTVGLLYEIDASSVPAGTEWPDGKGFRTDIEVVKPGPNGRLRVALELAGAQYRDVFAALCGDIAGVAMEQPPGQLGFGALLRRLQAWQRFMQLHTDRGLSDEQIRGLFGEITVLEQILFPMLGEVEATAAWQGRHALHDFSRFGHALEVKSGAASADPVMKISRLDQFDETAVRSLHVCFVQLKEDGAGGTSLPVLVARIRDRLKMHPGSLQRFDDLLVAAGYHDSRAANYSEPCLRACELQVFRVEGVFPRLRREELHTGIVAAKYTVSVGACSDFVTDSAAFESIFKGADNVVG